MNLETGISAEETKANNEDIARLLGEYFDLDDKVIAKKKDLADVK